MQGDGRTVEEDTQMFIRLRTVDVIPNVCVCNPVCGAELLCSFSVSLKKETLQKKKKKK